MSAAAEPRLYSSTKCAAAPSQRHSLNTTPAAPAPAVVVCPRSTGRREKSLLLRLALWPWRASTFVPALRRLLKAEMSKLSKPTASWSGRAVAVWAGGVPAMLALRATSSPFR
ncbi:MAG TPA: hypothetical protein DCM87_18260 [Planctomycetes bacterium]|nr:hypothetical protein [Planctomycetota bacterium]